MKNIKQILDHSDTQESLIKMKVLYDSDQENPEISFYMGLLNHRDGNFMEAIKFYKNSENISGGVPELHYNMGVSYEKLGEYALAEECYSRAVSLRKDYSLAQDALNKVQQMTRDASHKERLQGTRNSNSRKSSLIAFISSMLVFCILITIITIGIKTKDTFKNSYFFEFILIMPAFVTMIYAIASFIGYKRSTSFELMDEVLEYRSTGFTTTSKTIYLYEVNDCIFQRTIWDNLSNSARLVIKLEKGEHVLLYGWDEIEKMETIAKDIRERSFLARKNLKDKLI